MIECSVLLTNSDFFDDWTNDKSELWDFTAINLRRLSFYETPRVGDLIMYPKLSLFSPEVQSFLHNKIALEVKHVILNPLKVTNVSGVPDCCISHNETGILLVVKAVNYPEF